jgi:hypothetical protein
MAQDWSVHALVYFYSVGSDLPWAVLNWRLDLELTDMKTIIEMAREAGLIVDANQSGFDSVEAFAAIVRADERGRMCEQCKECLNEKSTSNEANRPAFLGEGGQAN